MAVVCIKAIFAAFYDFYSIDSPVLASVTDIPLEKSLYLLKERLNMFALTTPMNGAILLTLFNKWNFSKIKYLDDDVFSLLIDF